MKLVPLNDKIILKPAPEKTETDFGFQLTSTKEERPMTAEVLAVGPLIEHPDDDDEGAMANAKLIKPGVTLAFSKYSPTEFEYENEKYLIISLKDVLAVVEK